MSNHISARAGDQVAGFRFITKYLASMMQCVDIKPKILILNIKILINSHFFLFSVCFYPINVKKAETIGPTFLWDLAWPPWMIEFSKISIYRNSIFGDFENPQIFLKKFANFLFVLFYNVYREHVHNWNRRWAQKPSCSILYKEKMLTDRAIIALWKLSTYTGCPKKHGNSVTNSISSF